MELSLGPVNLLTISFTTHKVNMAGYQIQRAAVGWCFVQPSEDTVSTGNDSSTISNSTASFCSSTPSTPHTPRPCGMDVTQVPDCQGSYGGLYTLNGQDKYMKLFNDSLNPNEKEHIIEKIRQFVRSEWHQLDEFTSFPGQDSTLLPHTSNPCGYYINYYEQDRSNIATRLKQAVIAIQRLQQKTWIHGDIKLANIVFPKEADHNDKAILIDLEDPCNLCNWRNKGNSNVVMFSPITMNPVYIHYRQWTMSRPGATAKTINDADKLQHFINDYGQFHDIIYLNCCQKAVACEGFKDVMTKLLNAAVMTVPYLEFIANIASSQDWNRLYRLILYSDLFSLAMSCLVEGKFWTVTDFKELYKSNNKFLNNGWMLLCKYFNLVQGSGPPVTQVDVCALIGGSPMFYMRGGTTVAATAQRHQAQRHQAQRQQALAQLRPGTAISRQPKVAKQVDLDDYMSCFSKASVMLTTSKDSKGGLEIQTFNIRFPPEYKNSEEYKSIFSKGMLPLQGPIIQQE